MESAVLARDTLAYDASVLVHKHRRWWRRGRRVMPPTPSRRSHTQRECGRRRSSSGDRADQLREGLATHHSQPFLFRFTSSIDWVSTNYDVLSLSHSLEIGEQTKAEAGVLCFAFDRNVKVTWAGPRNPPICVFFFCFSTKCNTQNRTNKSKKNRTNKSQ